MKMPKKSRSPFYFFMKEYCEINSKPGHTIRMHQAAAEATPLWEKLNSFERNKYENLSKKSQEEKIKCNNENIPCMWEQDIEDQEFYCNMLKEIETTLARADALEDQIFHIIHINVFCYVDSIKQYYPAELSLTRFNLKNGIENKSRDIYHNLCVPGEFPLGYEYMIENYSGDTHQIPFPFDKNFNLRNVFQSVLHFLSQDIESAGSLPPVYALPKNIDIVREVMSNLCVRFGHNKSLVRVYEVERLFFNMCNIANKKAGRAAVYNSISNAILELEKDVYYFASGICCNIHKSMNSPIHCSKSIVTRNAYVICKNCCAPLQIKLIPGQHIPLEADIFQPNTDDPIKSEIKNILKARNPTSTFTGLNSALAFENELNLNMSRMTLSDYESINEDSEKNSDSGNHELNYTILSQHYSPSPSQPNSMDNEMLLDSRSWRKLFNREKLRRPNTLSAAFNQSPTKSIFSNTSTSCNTYNSALSETITSDCDIQSNKMSFESIRDKTSN